MTTVIEENVHCIAINGNFDDCQKIVKNIFLDFKFKNSFNLVAVNSINFARILAQIVYYFFFYFQITEDETEQVAFVVPTGNFGDILAGFYARQMGLPIKLVIATNENDILHRFTETGEYSIQQVKSTFSPAMDIQVSSNFERCLYHLTNHKVVQECMNKLKTNGSFQVEESVHLKFREMFSSISATDSQVKHVIILDIGNYQEMCC